MAKEKTNNLHSIGSYVVYWYGPSFTSTSLPVKREVLYEITGHEEVYKFGPSGPTEWLEVISFICEIEHPINLMLRIEDLPKPKYISKKEGLSFIEKSKAYVKN